MKKQALIALITLVPTLGFAKIADFNELIQDNMTAQSELHAEVKGNIKTVQDDPSNVRQRIVVVEGTSGSYNAPTREDMLAFRKERTYHRASEEKQFDRLATELSTAGE